jgi:hypothetical protein
VGVWDPAFFNGLLADFQELGADFGEEIERRASDAKLILDTALKYGVPVEMLWKPSAGSAVPLLPGGVRSTEK